MADCDHIGYPLYVLAERTVPVLTSILACIIKPTYSAIMHGPCTECDASHLLLLKLNMAPIFGTDISSAKVWRLKD